MELVLLEKENDFAQCLTEVLEERGAHVFRVSSYAELLDLLQRKTFEALVCDLRNDNQTREFLEAFFSLEKRPKKVIFTSIYQDSPQWTALRAHAGGHLLIAKPFRSDRLTAYLFGGGVADGGKMNLLKV
jgi:response regulator RpfG family c-di-GMP phosphodiesterase